MGDADPHVIQGHLGPPHPTGQTPFRSTSRLFRAHAPLSLYFTMRRHLPHPKIALCPGCSRPPFKTWLLWRTPAYQTASRWVQPLFAGYIVVTRYTDKPRHTSVAIGRIYTIHTMRPKMHQLCHLLQRKLVKVRLNWIKSCNLP